MTAGNAGEATGAGRAEASAGTNGTSGFDRALEGLRATGASVGMCKLVQQLAHHGSEEGRLLDAYKQLAETTNDNAVRYLTDLIMDDERRHHRLLVDVATSMAWEVVEGDDTAVPPLGWRLDGDLLAAIRTLREYEETDRRELTKLRKQLRPFEDTTLWALIVDMLLLDTEKHATILRFLERHARA